MLAIPARVIATLFTLACFAGTVLYGLFNGNHWESIMLSAAGIGLLAYLVGRLVGGIMLRGVNEQINRHKELNPFPEEESAAAPGATQDAGQPNAA